MNLFGLPPRKTKDKAETKSKAEAKSELEAKIEPKTKTELKIKIEPPKSPLLKSQIVSSAFRNQVISVVVVTPQVNLKTNP